MKFLFLVLLFTQNVFAQAFNHNYPAWKKVVEQFVDYSVMPVTVDYSGIRDNKDFKKHLQVVSDVDLSEYNAFTDKQKMSFLLNSYNALAIKLVLDVHKDKLPDTIKDADTLFTNAFRKSFFRFFGETTNLNKIQNDYGKDFFDDLRFYFSFSCAAKGCPPIGFYTAENLNEQLTKTIKLFLSYKKNANYLVKENEIQVSALMDFPEITQKSKKYFGLKDFLIRFMPISELQKDRILKNESSLKITYLTTDWALNKKK